jgi:hypothetical protein
MFLHHCDHCGRRELRGPRSLFTDEAGNFVAACRNCGTVSPVLATRPAPAVEAAPAPAAAAPALVGAAAGLVPTAA